MLDGVARFLVIIFAIKFLDENLSHCFLRILFLNEFFSSLRSVLFCLGELILFKDRVEVNIVVGEVGDIDANSGGLSQ